MKLFLLDRVSFDCVDRWIADVRRERGEEVVIFLVGNKADLADRRQVSEEEGKEKAEQLSCHFIEASAKTGANVKLLFQRIAQALPGLHDTSSLPVNAGDTTQLIDVRLGATNAGQASAASRCSC